ncbi:pyruvate ferredoxin oxidoreductase [Candidatus Pacearchaeota archaeon]|nr:pyruvate ferredoxin oxidoreductase [Candidatus Pacearchaeota archaeon]
MECSEAIAEAVRLCEPGVIATYPITPQTGIIEHLADIVATSKLNAEVINVESEHSAISACIGAQATGIRTFTASSSQGLALMHEMLFIASGLRLPIVMAIANRTLSAPINIWNDHSDTMAQRDSGWLQFYCETVQEAFDTTIMAFKIAESNKILLPAMVCVDGFTLSHVSEQLQILEQKQVDSFLPRYKAEFLLNPEKPITMGALASPQYFTEFKKQQQEAMLSSINVIKEVNKQFLSKFKRSYGDGLIEEYKTNDAEKVFIALGSVCGTIREAIDEMRKKGKKVGLVKIKTFRPFPEKELLKATKKAKKIAVIDRAVSLGNLGPVFVEVKALLKNCKNDISNFIAGLGGKDITKRDITESEKFIGEKNLWI